MAPAGAPGVEVVRLADATAGRRRRCRGRGLRLRPAARVRRPRWPRGAAGAPVWINLEYLSAEAYVERSHGLPSPQHAARRRSDEVVLLSRASRRRTGGLLREPGLLDAPGARSTAPPGSRARASRCAPASALRQPVLLRNAGRCPPCSTRWRARRPLLLVRRGPPRAKSPRCSARRCGRGALRAHRAAWLSQTDYDHLLWACDLNFVRGEDSFVRAHGPARPSSGRSTRRTTAPTSPSSMLPGRFVAGARAGLRGAARAFGALERLATARCAGRCRPRPLSGLAGRTARAGATQLLAQDRPASTQLLGFVEPKHARIEGFAFRLTARSARNRRHRGRALSVRPFAARKHSP